MTTLDTRPAVEAPGGAALGLALAGALREALVPRYTVDAHGRLVDCHARRSVPVCPVCEGEILDYEQGCVTCRSERQRWFSS